MSASIPNCTICDNSYNQVDRVPSILHCGHTYCAACLDQVAKRIFQDCIEIKCPGCNQITQARKVTTNYIVLDMLTESAPKRVEAAKARAAVSVKPKLAVEYYNASDTRQIVDYIRQV